MAVDLFVISDAWRTAFPMAHAGVLVMKDAGNPDASPELERRKEGVVQEIRARYEGQSRIDLASNPILQAYDAYYKRFKKTYHVQLQLESIAFKGKSLPGESALVEAMFMAEIDDLLLTAGHDLDAVRLPARLDATVGNEVYTLLRGQPQTVKAGDMMIVDGEGIISNIIYGPDQRTRIGTATRNVLYTTYAPPGVDGRTVRVHLQKIESYVRLFAPQARTELLNVYE